MPPLKVLPHDVAGFGRGPCCALDPRVERGPKGVAKYVALEKRTHTSPQETTIQHVKLTLRKGTVPHKIITTIIFPKPSASLELL
jgi:hypothetical protein